MKALVWVFSVKVKTDESFAALVEIINSVRGQAEVVSWVSLSSLHPCLQEGGERFQGKRKRKDFQFAVLLLLCLCTLI